jgi:hypothetical protein
VHYYAYALPKPHIQDETGDICFILELLNEKDHMAFFKLQKGGCKANNTQKEKWQLAQKRSHTAKQEQVREEAKAAKLPPILGSAYHAGMSLPYTRL